jgi:ligand-binding sensor domain-containing protein
MASAANPITTNFAATSYRVRDGLPEDIVQAFAQTSDGYLWIGTTGGLVRFDGARFAVLSNQHGPAFHEISVHCLAASKDGSLWIGTEGSGLIQYRNGTFHAYTSNEGLSDMFVRAISGSGQTTAFSSSSGTGLSASMELVDCLCWPSMRFRKTIGIGFGLAVPGSWLETRGDSRSVLCRDITAVIA